GSACPGSRSDRAGPRRHRRSVVRPSGRALLSRLLPGLLLSATVRILRGASVVCPLADFRHRCVRRFGGGVGTGGGAYSPTLAGREDSITGRRGLLPGETDGLVRGPGPGLPLRSGAEPAFEETGRGADGAS